MSCEYHGAGGRGRLEARTRAEKLRSIWRDDEAWSAAHTPSPMLRVSTEGHLGWFLSITWDGQSSGSRGEALTQSLVINTEDVEDVPAHCRGVGFDDL